MARCENSYSSGAAGEGGDASHVNAASPGQLRWDRVPRSKVLASARGVISKTSG
jgi:hypothetical protein